jgi:spore germination protein KC
MKKIFFYLLFCFLFTGCFNYRELNDLAITNAVGVEKVADGYKVTVQVLNTQKAGDGNTTGTNAPFYIYEETNESLTMAFRNILSLSAKRIYALNLQLLLIDDDLAHDGIKEVLEFFMRDVESRKQFLVAITKDTSPSAILSVVTPTASLSSEQIVFGIMADYNYLAQTEVVTLENLANSYLDKDLEIVLPTVELIGKDGENTDNLKETATSENVKIGPRALFKKDELIGYTTEEESLALSILRNKINNTVLNVKREDGLASAKLSDFDTSIEVIKDLKTFNIKTKFKISLSEITCDIDIETIKGTNEIITIFEDRVQKLLEDSINSIIENYQTDVFNFKILSYKNYPEKFNKIKDWDTTYLPNLKFKIKTEASYAGKGNTLGVITDDK